MSKLLNENRDACLKASESIELISPLIHVGQFKVDAARVLDDFHMDVSKKMENTVEAVARDLKTNAETAAELMDVCNPERLKCSREKGILEWHDIQTCPKDTGLETVDAWFKVNRDRSINRQPRVLKSRYSDYDCHMEIEYASKPPKDENDRIQQPETVLTIAVNFPRSLRVFKHTNVHYRVLGSQKLTALRDVIPCVIDEQPVGTFTDNPDLPKDIKCKDVFKAGCFFIGSTFYNDRRCEQNNDLSEIIYKWADANDVIIPSDYKSVSMEDYTFDDLDLRLGAPYLYMHQGDCEHTVIFQDIRLLHPDDCLSRSTYPMSISRARFRVNLCKVCNYFMAKWLTRNDELSDEDPSFFCDACFRSLHYNTDGTKAAEFVAYPYISREELGCL